jgi:predicted protein tyrosine phosphatase
VSAAVTPIKVLFVCSRNQWRSPTAEHEHRSAVGSKPIHVLHIADDYKYMDPALVEQIEASVKAVLGL